MNPDQHYHSGKRDHTVTVRCLSKERWMLELNGMLNTAGRSRCCCLRQHIKMVLLRGHRLLKGMWIVSQPSVQADVFFFTAMLWEGYDFNVSRLGRSKSQVTPDVGGWYGLYTTFLIRKSAHFLLQIIIIKAAHAYISEAETSDF